MAVLSLLFSLILDYSGAGETTWYVTRFWSLGFNSHFGFNLPLYLTFKNNAASHLSMGADHRSRYPALAKAPITAIAWLPCFPLSSSSVYGLYKLPLKLIVYSYLSTHLLIFIHLFLECQPSFSRGYALRQT